MERKEPPVTRGPRPGHLARLLPDPRLSDTEMAGVRLLGCWVHSCRSSRLPSRSFLRPGGSRSCPREPQSPAFVPATNDGQGGTPLGGGSLSGGSRLEAV